jgi:hypothetical protein
LTREKQELFHPVSALAGSVNKIENIYYCVSGEREALYKEETYPAWSEEVHASYVVA